MRICALTCTAFILIAAASLAADTPPNNNWSGVPLGSWIEQENHQKERGVENKSRTRMIVSEHCANGTVGMESFRQVNGKWLRCDYSSASGSGCYISLDGLIASPDSGKLRTVATAEGVKRVKEAIVWTEIKLPDEAIELAGRKMECKVREWADKATPAVRLKIWFCDAVTVPTHMEFFGPYVLTVCTSPHIVKMEWNGGAQRAQCAVNAFDQVVDVGGKPVNCILWESNARGGKTLEWLSETVPSHVVQAESEERGIAFGSKTVAVQIEKEPLKADPVPAAISSWKGFPIGSWISYASISTRKDYKADDVVKKTLLGFTSLGYPVLEVAHLNGEEVGKVVHVLDMPESTLFEKTIVEKKVSEADFPLDGPVLKARFITQNCKDEWDRPWRCVLTTEPAMKLPLRHFHSWFVEATLDPQTLAASAEVEGQTLSRKVLTLRDKVVVAGKDLICVRESELLKARTEKTSTIWSSTEVPGHLVKSTSEEPGDGQTSFNLLEYSNGK